jgi:SM-20-related protein
MSLLDLDALRATPRKTDPYDYVVVPNFVSADALARVIGDFPRIETKGSLPLSELDLKGAFKSLIDEMDGAAFRDLIADKFDVDLATRPTMFTVRGRCHRGDGKIHTDTGTKIITVLLYLNQAWEADGGRLRILRSPTLDDAAEEVSPTGGTLLVFRRSEKSWHGHQPFEGARRAIQMNWVTDESVVAYEQRRHRVSAFFKRLNPFRGAA